MDKVVIVKEQASITEKEYKQLTSLAAIGATVVWGIALYGTCKAVKAIATVAKTKSKKQ